MNSYVTTVELGLNKEKPNFINKKDNFKETIIKNGLDDGKAKIITNLVYKLYENCGELDCVLEPNYWLKNQKYEKKLWDANKEYIKKCSEDEKQFMELFKNEESLYYNKFMYEYCPLIKIFN